MVDGDVVHAVVEVVDRVAAVSHHAHHEAVRLLHGLGRPIDEPPLHAEPLLAVPVGVGTTQGHYVELRTPLLPLPEQLLSGPTVVGLLDSAFVLGTEPLLQPGRPLSPIGDGRDGRRDDHNDHEDDDDLHGSLPTWSTSYPAPGFPFDRRVTAPARVARDRAQVSRDGSIDRDARGLVRPRPLWASPSCRS